MAWWPDELRDHPAQTTAALAPNEPGRCTSRRPSADAGRVAAADPARARRLRLDAKMMAT